MKNERLNIPDGWRTVDWVDELRRRADLDGMSLGTRNDFLEKANDIERQEDLHQVRG